MKKHWQTYYGRFPIEGQSSDTFQVVGYADPDSEPNVILGGLGLGGQSDEGNFQL